MAVLGSWTRSSLAKDGNQQMPCLRMLSRKTQDLGFRNTQPSGTKYQVGGEIVALKKKTKAGTTLLRASRPAPTGSAPWSREVGRGCRCRCIGPAAGGTGSVARQPGGKKAPILERVAVQCCQLKKEEQTSMVSLSTCSSASHC